MNGLENYSVKSNLVGMYAFESLYKQNRILITIIKP